ncbi:alpha/beta hydrolase family protein [Sphingobacterium sp. FBM7-1]|uniref:alpha/beta hydrolase family protein n=1 Tax=Sphingobacterium sp. FBM7-1 TaxID=2886688 RepID=UPI001D1303BD|nr:CocE/NonD family hydrolase [Sphingobacterium sp. FBM7-1]MCC2598901.1 acetylxylan esterase [Sphingobacterium sp. FBM7-1]
MKGILAIIVACLCCSSQFSRAQNSDNKFRIPLEDVIGMLEERYDIQIKYDENQVKDKWLNYAKWRFRPDVDETLRNVLSPLDLKVNKEGNGKYKLKEYEYYRWEPQDGWDYLDYLASQYHDKGSWEDRKQALRADVYEALKLSPLPSRPESMPLVTKKRKFKDYTVENFALEILPGVYINGSIYRPLKTKGAVPLVMSPDGHWFGHRFRKDAQIRYAMLAKMGAVAVSYDLFAWGESGLQFDYSDHRRSLAVTIQTLGALRILDWMLADKNIDTERVGICGGSGGGSQSVLLTALDDRIKLSVPVVSLSSYHFGGCPCESGMPIHAAAGGTNNVELAAMAAPRPQLLISDGKDWTAHMPEHDFPYLQTIYGYYGKADLVKNIHLPEDAHDFGYSKRKPVYDFISKHFNLDTKGLKDATGDYDESGCIIEEETALYAFGPHGENLPSNAIKGYENLEKLFKKEAYESIK